MFRRSATRIFALMWLGTAQLSIPITSPQLFAAGPESGVQTALAAAEKGDAQAQYSLAKRYAKGNGLPQDYSKAAEYMRKAAEQGYALAQNDLGAYYARGLGLKQDYAEAARWYRKAADQGDSLAQYSMGRITLLGRGVTKDK